MHFSLSIVLIILAILVFFTIIALPYVYSQYIRPYKRHFSLNIVLIILVIFAIIALYNFVMWRYVYVFSTLDPLLSTHLREMTNT